MNSSYKQSFSLCYNIQCVPLATEPGIAISSLAVKLLKKCRVR